MKTNITSLFSRTPLKTTVNLRGGRRTILTYATAPGLRGMRVLRGTGRATLNVAIGNPIPQQPPPIEVGPAPVLTSLNPDSSGTWDALVVLSGSNFKQTSVVLANNQVVQNVTFVSASELDIVVPGIHQAGVYAVKVRNGSQESNSLNFTAL